MNFRTFLALSVAALLAMVTAVSPVAAQDGDEVEAALTNALDAVVAELAYAEMAGLLGQPVAPRVQALAETVGIERLDAASAEAAFRDIDDLNGPSALVALGEADVSVSPPVKRVLDPGTVEAASRPIFAPYVTAYADLLAARLRVTDSELNEEADFADLLPVLGSLSTLNFGPPPAQLPQVDDFVIGRQLGEPSADGAGEPAEESTFLGAGLTETAMFGGVAGTLLALVLVSFFVSRRRLADATAPSNEELLDVGRAVNACTSIDQLCDEVAQQARNLGADAAMVTIDGVEAHSGEAFETSSELVLRANRERRFVVTKAVTAVPLIVAGRVVGLLSVHNGDGRIMEAFVPVVEQAYRSITKHKKTEELVFVDGLTGIANRRRFDTDLEMMMGLVSNDHIPVAVAMFDVDNFKAFNDRNGHQAGDGVLRGVAELIASNLRTSDVVYRYGGEEFVALLPGATVDDAYIVIERIRIAVEEAEFAGEADDSAGRVTISVGIAAAAADESVDLVRAADLALYEAKQTGRNRVVIEASI